MASDIIGTLGALLMTLSVPGLWFFALLIYRQERRWPLLFAAMTIAALVFFCMAVAGFSGLLDFTTPVAIVWLVSALVVFVPFAVGPVLDLVRWVSQRVRHDRAG